jgi:flagellar protein FlgJ
MRETRFASEDDPFANSNSLKLYQELLDQQWAQRMAGGRGLGFAEAMYAALSRNTVQPPSGDTGVTAGDAGSPGATGASGASVPAPAPVAPVAIQPAHAGLAADRQAFIDSLRPHAEEAAAELGLPGEFLLAQAALETGWGRRRIVDAAGAESYNLFGIKAGAGWTGATVDTLTTEYRQGLAVKSTETFRAYEDYAAAFRDYADLLRRRYPQALAAGADATAFANGLASGGYATDPAYAEKLQRVIARLA